MDLQYAKASAVDLGECRFVEVLTADISGEKIGYRFGGKQPGPNALVAGDSVLIEAVFDRLTRVPTLPWMWGMLFMVQLDSIECADLEDVRKCLSHVVLDDLILLPHTKGLALWQQSVDQAYWTTLRLCRRLGMIEGRGIHLFSDARQHFSKDASARRQGTY